MCTQICKIKTYLHFGVLTTIYFNKPTSEAFLEYLEGSIYFKLKWDPTVVPLEHTINKAVNTCNMTRNKRKIQRN